MQAKFEFLQHRLRLFLSVDIVGSTPFKQGQELVDASPGPPWFGASALFYSQMSVAVAKRWEWTAASVLPELAGAAPVFWKAQGDELLYFKEIQDHRQALHCLSAWKSAVAISRAALRSAFPSLDLKSSSWVANFPGPNAELVFESMNNKPAAPANSSLTTDDSVFENLKRLQKYYSATTTDSATRWLDNTALVLDFIGPSMDTGFRLGALATPRKLIISIGLAWMLAEALSEVTGCLPYEAFVLHYDGPAQLKGILGGTPYPVFWVDLMPNDPRSKAEARLLRREEAHEAAARDTIAFCAALLREKSPYFFPPYIDPLNNPSKFADIPNAHSKRLKSLKNLWAKRSSTPGV